MPVKQIMAIARRVDTVMGRAFFRACVVKLYGRDARRPWGASVGGGGSITHRGDRRYDGAASCMAQRTGVRGL